MLAYIKQNVRLLLIWVLGMTFVGSIVYFLPLIIHTRIPPSQVTEITVISIMSFVLLLVILTSIVPWRGEFKATSDSRVQNLPANIDDVIKELKVDDLLQSLAQLESDKEHLNLDKKRLELEGYQLFFEWQQEVLDLLEMNPQSAIIVAWLWFEQDMKRMARRLPLFDENGKEMPESLDEILSALEINGDIDWKMLTDIREMHAFRNRVAYRDTGEIDMEIAVSFIQQAFDISKNMAKRMWIEQN